MYNQDFNDEVDVDADDEDEGYYNDPVDKISFGANKQVLGSKERKLEEVQKNLNDFYLDE